MQDDAEQERLLGLACQKVKEQTNSMIKALEQSNLKDGLMYGRLMLEELRETESVQLNPTNYYILFMKILDEMRILEQYFKDEYKRGTKMIDIYESVQEDTKLIPRLYLQITAGSVLIETNEVSAKDILLELLDMIKAVQDPTRGLFLRYYFLKLCKNRLPDKNSEYYGKGGDLYDCINIITSNLFEINKLWIKMSRKSKDKPRTEKVRIQLELTVGENVSRLSSLEGVNSEIYNANILPKLLDIIKSSKDAISQNYLINCIISCFPDEYHLLTLPQILSFISTQLVPEVDIKSIFISFLDRLTEFVITMKEIQKQFNLDNNIFIIFKTNIDNLIAKASSAEFKNVLDLMNAFLKFSQRCYGSNSNYVNQILQSFMIICSKQAEQDFTEECLKNIISFLTMPLEAMPSTIITIGDYQNMMKYLPFMRRRQFTMKILKTVTTLKMKICQNNIAQQLIIFMQPFILTEKDSTEVSESEFQEQQNLVSRVIHLVFHEDVQEYWDILSLLMNKLSGSEIKSKKYTSPAMFFALAKYTRYLYSKKKQNDVLNFTNIFAAMKEIIDTLAEDYHSLALNLYLQLILIINEFDTEKKLDKFTYQICSQVLTIYQDQILDSDAKISALQIIIGSFSRVDCLSKENFDTLSAKVSQCSQKFLKKNDQVLSILQCTHLLFRSSLKDAESVANLFRRSIKIVEAVLKINPKSIGLFVNIVNRIFIFWANPTFAGSINVPEVQELIGQIKKQISSLQKSPENDAIQIYWRNTVEYIRNKQLSKEIGFNQLNV